MKLARSGQLKRVFSGILYKNTRDILQFHLRFLRMSAIDKANQRDYNLITKSFKYI